jgi:hypothetical protein
MRAEIGLIVEWSASVTAGDDWWVIDTQDVLLDYIVDTLQSNANYDRVDLKVESYAAKALDG